MAYIPGMTLTSPKFISGLGEIAEHYDAIFCDVWGVLHNGRRAFTLACDALATFRKSGKPVVLLTNAPVQAAQVEGLFQPLGVRPDCYDLIASSGDATRLELQDRLPGPAFRFGTDEGWERDDTLFAGLDLAFSEPDDAKFMIAMGLRDQVNDHPNDYRDELIGLAQKSLPMICANPDIQVRVGERLLWCAGALAQIYEEIGGEVIYPGKPYAPIYRLARQHLISLGVAVSDATRILTIGDGPVTDIRGAMNEDLHSLYVGTGLTQAGSDFREQTRDLFSQENVMSTYAMPELTW